MIFYRFWSDFGAIWGVILDVFGVKLDEKTGIDIKRVFTYFLSLFIYFPMKPRPAESRILVGFSCIFSMFSQVASRIVFVSILLRFGAIFHSFFDSFG